MLLVRDDVV